MNTHLPTSHEIPTKVMSGDEFTTDLVAESIIKNYMMMYITASHRIRILYGFDDEEAEEIINIMIEI